MLCECFLYMGKSLFVFKLRFLGIQKLNINILLTSSFINPEVQRINSQGNLIQLLADICKVFDFIVGDLTVSGDLDQTAGERVDLIKTSDGFQDNGRKLGNLDLLFRAERTLPVPHASPLAFDAGLVENA